MRMRKLILIVDTGLEFAQIDKVRKRDYYYYSFFKGGKLEVLLKVHNYYAVRMLLFY